jgi:hypothetical protein
VLEIVLEIVHVKTGKSIETTVLSVGARLPRNAEVAITPAQAVSRVIHDS